MANIHSIQELNKTSYVNLTGKNPKNVFDRLSSLRNQGKEALKNKQEEKAYIFFRRWQSCVDYIKNQEKIGKKTYSLLVSEKDVIIS